MHILNNVVSKQSDKLNRYNINNSDFIVIDINSIDEFLYKNQYSAQNPENICSFLHTLPNHRNKTTRQSFFDSKRDKKGVSYINLELVFEQRVQQCVEYALLSHVLLAQLGYPSKYISAETSPSDGRHAFVLYLSGTNEKRILDPLNGIYAGLLDYQGAYNSYDRNFKSFSFVTPKHPKFDYEINDIVYGTLCCHIEDVSESNSSNDGCCLVQ